LTVDANDGFADVRNTLRRNRAANISKANTGTNGK